MAGNPRVYGQLVPILGKYSKFAGAGDKAAVRQAAEDDTAEASASSAPESETAAPSDASATGDAPF